MSPHHPTFGMAHELVLPDGKFLFHGSLAAKFTHQHPANQPHPIHYVHPPMPDGPAWFADNEKFSLHAAVRFVQAGTAADITLHSYKVYAPLNMTALPDIPNFREFMREQFKVTAPLNGLMEGLVLARDANEVGSRSDGYALLKDAVREEPEYVLYDSGLRRLRAENPRTIHVVPIDHTHSRLVDATTGRQLAVYKYGNGPGTLV